MPMNDQPGTSHVPMRRDAHGHTVERGHRKPPEQRRIESGDPSPLTASSQRCGAAEPVPGLDTRVDEDPPKQATDVR